MLPAVVSTASPSPIGALASDSAWIAGPPAREIAPATPPPCSSRVFAAFAIASTSSFVMSVWRTSISAIADQVQLPGHAEAVVQPGELATEAVVAERHEEGAAFAKGRDGGIDLALVVELDRERHRRREGELVRGGAVHRGELATREHEARVPHARFALVLSVALDRDQTRIVEERHVETDRLLRLAR